MKTKRGKIAVTYEPPLNVLEREIQESKEVEKLLEVEMYLNDKTALDVFKKFGVLIRVHL